MRGWAPARVSRPLRGARVSGADSGTRGWENGGVSTHQPYPAVPVRGEIKLGQFLKLAGLVEDGASARLAVQCGDVSVNGRVERRRGHRLEAEDVVEVEAPSARVGARVAGA